MAWIAEIEVDKTSGRVQVKRVVCVQDMGLVINPEGAKIQMEGCITMGLGYALAEEVRFKGGEVHDLNFGSYKIPRFSWLPQIETVLIDAKDSPPQGGGEPAIIGMGAVAGQRGLRCHRRTPVSTPHDSQAGQGGARPAGITLDTLRTKPTTTFKKPFDPLSQ